MVLDLIRKIHQYQSFLEGLKGKGIYPGLAMPRAARLPVTAALHLDLGQPLLLITDRTDRAIALMDELSFWTPDAELLYFPEPTAMFYEKAPWGIKTRHDRLQVLAALAAYHIPGRSSEQKQPIIVAPVRAVMARTLPRRDFLKSTHKVTLSQKVQPETLLRDWVSIGYCAAETVVEPGYFARRGGILDIWPPSESLPLRLDFFGDEIDTMRRFDPATQRTIANLASVWITPAKEFLPGKWTGMDLQGEELSEYHLPLLHLQAASVLDYLSSQCCVVFDDQEIIQSTAIEIEEQSVTFRQDSISEGTLKSDFPVPYLSWSEVEDNISGRCWLDYGWKDAEEPSDLAQAFIPGPRFAGRLKQFVDHLAEIGRPEDIVFVVSRQKNRLVQLWDEYKQSFPIEYMPNFVEGSLAEGWTLSISDSQKIHLLTDGEIFGWERPRPRQPHRPIAEAPESGYADLRVGDWVVHVDFGVGRYSGLVNRKIGGIEREYLCVEYEGGDQIFVPVHQADRLSRYIGPDARPPSLTRLGSAEWSNAKERVREAAAKLAQELLEIYAKRQVAEGFRFTKDNQWQEELETAFPYIETQDQLRAITEVKRDMESHRPMDRLLCGDVGYGKTEVALRAAFKAVLNGKQVAVLVPTTVLAQQHFETFRQRLVPFPVVVEMLSRFRTPKEQGEIIKKLASGGIDIVIGTHRLLQTDVVFKDLGLVIIDEEQRFGVTHKEYFKKLRTELDVLTLTATPIPRTLYMALTGVRDISNINTPPEERQPIITHIGPYSPRLVRQAILRELERGGQVFFVHNRVQTIRGMEHQLNQLVPEARVGVGHGQMPETELADVMQRFTSCDIDVLLSTSIIESGLDIPNANTLIVDRGDTFGLAQLYQLRGRVGRGAQRAYAYFFRHQRNTPTPEGRERLEVIAENTQLGAGYSIAMRDLEMRGAGELLGNRQHGHIAAVGFFLYTQLLAQAVRDLRKFNNLPVGDLDRFGFKEGRIPVNVELPLTIGILPDYVPEQGLRLRLYRRLADLRSQEEIQAFHDELIDRFGQPPEMVENLLYQMKIKILAEKIGLASITIELGQIVLRYPPLPDGGQARQLPNISPYARSGKNAYWLELDTGEGDWKATLFDTLGLIERLSN